MSHFYDVEPAATTCQINLPLLIKLLSEHQLKHCFSVVVLWWITEGSARPPLPLPLLLQIIGALTDNISQRGGMVGLSSPSPSSFHRISPGQHVHSHTVFMWEHLPACSKSGSGLKCWERKRDGDTTLNLIDAIFVCIEVETKLDLWVLTFHPHFISAFACMRLVLTLPAFLSMMLRIFGCWHWCCDYVSTPVRSC